MNYLGKKNIVIYLIILLTVIGKYILINYGLPFQTHVDEFLIIKDPLKILLTYKQLDFTEPTNLFNWILIFWHFIVATLGILLGSWSSYNDYIVNISTDSTQILLGFRFLNLILATLANLVLIQFVLKKINTSDLLKILLIGVIVLNPIEWNSNGFVKFDSFAYLAYSLLIYFGYEFFVEQKKIQRKLYLLLFIAVAIRIENIAFLTGYIIYDFSVINKFSLKSYLNKELIKTLLLSLFIYSAITLIPITLIYNAFMDTKIVLTQTKTFEEVVSGHVNFTGINRYTVYMELAIFLLNPIVLIGFIIQLFKNKKAENFLLIPLIIINIVLALDELKNIFYFLASSLIIILFFIQFCQNINIKTAILLSSLTIIYFLSYDVQLLYSINKYENNKIVREKTIAITGIKDTIAIVGTVDIGMLENEKILEEKIKSIKEIGGATGRGLAQKHILALKTPKNTRNFYTMCPDYFWTNTKYQNKWLIGMDTIRLNELKPKLIIIFSIKDEIFNTNPSFVSYLDQHYNKHYEKKNSFTDYRLNYRNFYYFMKSYIYLKK